MGVVKKQVDELEERVVALEDEKKRFSLPFLLNVRISVLGEIIIPNISYNNYLFIFNVFFSA